MDETSSVRTQFSFTAFETKLFIEGIEVPINNFSIRYTENQPSILTANTNISAYSSEFINNVLKNRPLVILALRATGEKYNEDWHNLFVGYLTNYSLLISNNDVSLNISAIDFLGLYKETIMYAINPAIRWIDVMALYKDDGILWSGDWYKKIMGDIITEGFYQSMDSLFNFVSLTTNAQSAEYRRKAQTYGAPVSVVSASNIATNKESGAGVVVCSAITGTRGSEQMIAHKSWNYTLYKNSDCVPDPNVIMIRHPAKENLKTAKNYFSNAGSYGTKNWDDPNFHLFFSDSKARLNWMTLSIYLTRAIWVINDFLKISTTINDNDLETTKRSKIQFRKNLGIKDDEEFGVAIITLTSGWRHQNADRNHIHGFDGAPQSLHKCAAAADFVIDIKKISGEKWISIGRLHSYILYRLMEMVFRNGFISIYSSAVTNNTHFIHVDIGPFGRAGNQKTGLFRNVLQIQYNDYVNKHKEDGILALEELLSEYTISKRYEFVEGTADSYFYNFKSDNLPQEIKTVGTNMEDGKTGNINLDFFGNIFGLKVPATSTTKPEEVAISIEKQYIETNYGLAFVRARQECKTDLVEKDYEGGDLIVYQTFTHNNYNSNIWSPIPCCGKFRPFLLTNIICPEDSARWSISYAVIKDLMGAQADSLSRTEFTLWDQIMAVLNAAMYEIVPIPCGAQIIQREIKKEIEGEVKFDTIKKTAFWMIIPRLSTVDISGKCVPIPECNIFSAASSWAPIEYSINISKNPTAIAGLINLGDTEVVGDSGSPFSHIASLYPLDLAYTVDKYEQRDLKFRETYTNEERWRGPNRMFVNYDMLRIGLMSSEMVKASMGQGMIEAYRNALQDEQMYLLLHDFTFRDYYESVLGSSTIAFTTGYWPYIMIGFPAYIQTPKFNVYGIINSVSISGGQNNIMTSVVLRNAFTSLDNPQKIIEKNMGSGFSVFDPWLMEEDLKNIKKALYTVGAAVLDDKNNLVLKRTRPLFSLNKLDEFKLLCVRKEMRDIAYKHARWLAGIGMGVAWDLLSGENSSLYNNNPTWETLIIGSGETEKYDDI